MPAYNPLQKQAIQQFVAVTSAKESVAARTLKSHDWKVDQAINAYFNSQNNTTPNQPSSTSGLSKLFDKYKSASTSFPSSDPKFDTIDIEGSMRYFGDLGLELDDPLVFVLLTELSAPTMGVITRQGFIDGWKRLRANTLPEQKTSLPHLRSSLPNPQSETFQKTYRHAFKLALAPGQRSLPLDTAIEYWRLLLSPPAVDWNTTTTPWLEYWIEYLENQWKKGVSKDMWAQTSVFVKKSLEDESMGWWSEDGAWPSCLDEFVGFVKGKREAEGTMEL